MAFENTKGFLGTIQVTTAARPSDYGGFNCAREKDINK